MHGWCMASVQGTSELNMAETLKKTGFTTMHVLNGELLRICCVIAMFLLNDHIDLTLSAEML